MQYNVPVARHRMSPSPSVTRISIGKCNLAKAMPWLATSVCACSLYLAHSDPSVETISLCRIDLNGRPEQDSAIVAQPATEGHRNRSLRHTMFDGGSPSHPMSDQQ